MAARTFIWVVTISIGSITSRCSGKEPAQTRESGRNRAYDFPNFEQTGEKIPHPIPQTLASPASLKAVKSRIPSRYLSFCRFPHRILVKSRIPRTPFQILLMWREDVLVRLEQEKSFGDTGAVEKFELIGTIFVPKASHPS